MSPKGHNLNPFWRSLPAEPTPGGMSEVLVDRENCGVETALDSAAASFEFDMAFFGRCMRTLGRADSTIRLYAGGVRRFFTHLHERDGVRSEPQHIHRDQVRWFVDHLIGTHPPTAAKHHVQALRAFFEVLEVEGVIGKSPVGEMRAPSTVSEPSEILRLSEISALLRACRGSSFIDRRDLAMARVFVSTGARRSEVTNLRINPLDYGDGDVELDRGTIRLLGKGGVSRRCSVDPATIRALERYLRMRVDHPHHPLSNLWLTRFGGMTASAVHRSLKQRARSARIDNFRLHRIRHTYAHEWLKAGGSEGDLMRVMGWRSREMVDYYSASVAEERAIAAARKHAMSLLL